jgi:hypothetical protein
MLPSAQKKKSRKAKRQVFFSKFMSKISEHGEDDLTGTAMEM